MLLALPSPRKMHGFRTVRPPAALPVSLPHPLTREPPSSTLARCRSLKYTEQEMQEATNPKRGKSGVNQLSNRVRNWIRRVRKAGGAGIHLLLQAPAVAVEEYRIRYELAACLNFKNAAPYLAEWLEFHLLVGFEHFYLYNNNSDDDYEAVLEPYIQAGIVSLFQWPESPAFPKSYEHCVARHQHETRWIAFLDDDEFLFPTTHVDLRKILRNYEFHPAVVVHWILFGSSGHVHRVPGLVTENYLRRAEAVDRHIKTIVNPRRLARVLNPHYCKYKDKQWAVDENKRPQEGATGSPATADILRINHYSSKSLEDWTNKVNRGAQELEENPYKIETWHKTDAALNAVEDREILRFLPELKQRLEARKAGLSGAEK